MHVNPQGQTDAEGVIEQLDRILRSPIFITARRSQMFLRFVVERSLTQSAPKEYEIAVEVLGRDNTYDPEIDAAVRVEASRLRSRLREYYDTTGQTDPILISIPKGRYAATFEYRETAPILQSPAIPRSNPSVSEQPDPLNSASGPTTPSAALPLQRTHSTWFLGSGLWLTVVFAAVAVPTVLLSVKNRKVPSADRIRSLAVLPLQNLSGDPNQDYFADGMTDALITELAHTPNLRVVSRTSVMQDKGTHKSLRQIASELDVDAVVEGSVVRSGNRVRVTAQLIDTRTDRHLWAQTFEEQMSDVLALQDNVVREIAFHAQAALAPSRSPTESARINPDAYDAYLRGLYFLNLRDTAHSTTWFQQAVSLDPRYPAAYAGLAQALANARVLSDTSPPNTEQQALAAAHHAIQLDPASADAYAALGFVEISYSRNWSAAGRDLEKSIALNPNNSLAELQYSIYLDAVRRPDDAVAHMRRSLRLDPLSFLVNRHLASTLYFDRRYDESLLYLRRAAEMEPRNFRLVENWFSRTYEMLGELDSAEHSDLAVLGDWFPPTRLGPLRRAYSQGGWKAYQKARITLLLTRPKLACADFEIGESYLRLGDLDRAFSALDRGVTTSCFWAYFLPVDPLLDPLRTDPRYPTLLQQVLLPPLH